MITLSTLLSFTGFFLLYNTSGKAVLNSSTLLETWVQDNPRPAKYIAVLLFLAAVSISTFFLGFGSGLFAFFVILMTVASLIVLLAPLKYVSYRIVWAAFLISIVLELFSI